MRVEKYIVMMFALLIVPVVALGQDVFDRIAAIVDDDIILESEVLQGAYFLAMQQKINPETDAEKFEQLKKNALDNLIVQEIMLTKAEEDTVVPDAAQVESYLEQQMQTILQQLGSEDKVEEYFGLPIRKIRRNYEQEITKNLTVRMLQEQKFADVQVSRNDVERFFEAKKDSLPSRKETVDISHIFLKVKPGEEARNSAINRMNEIKRRLEEGEDFAELAQQFSDDPGSRDRGGELGFTQRGDFVKEFEEVAFALEEGERSDIVETQYGFHIIEMIEKRGEKIRVRHILAGAEATEADKQATIEQLREIYRQLTEEGADFIELVKQYSEDESSLPDNGHLGEFDLDQLAQTAQAFIKALKDVSPGEVTAPFQSQFGYHIIKLNSRQDSRDLSLDKDWEDIERLALDQKRRKELASWIEDLRSEIYVEIKKP